MPVTPPRPKGPPLNALRAFEAAARLGGFSAAADELCVTAGAISQHIRSLEDWTGQPLFERRSHGVQLTAEGRHLLPQLTHAFDAIGTAVRGLRDLSQDRIVTIAALPSVAQLWLQPRLGLFREALGGVNLSVTVAETPPNLDRELFDLSLYMREPDARDGGIVLVYDSLIPVCAPDVAARLSTPADLAGQTLLHDEVWANDWPRWANAAGVTLTRPEDGPRFSLYSMAIEEAKASAGVLIGHTALLDGAVADGSLVMPFKETIKSPSALVADVARGPFENTLRTLLTTLAS
ncbi:MAG: LysR family transcriptional regulator [Octadecabacter sp.]